MAAENPAADYEASVGRCVGHRVIETTSGEVANKRCTFVHYKCEKRGREIIVRKREDYTSRPCPGCGQIASAAAETGKKRNTAKHIAARMEAVTQAGLESIGPFVDRMVPSAKWKCREHGHEFTQAWASINQRLRKGENGCKVCFELARKVQKVGKEKKEDVAEAGSASAEEEIVYEPYEGRAVATHREYVANIKVECGISELDNATHDYLASYRRVGNEELYVEYRCNRSGEVHRRLADNIRKRGCMSCNKMVAFVATLGESAAKYGLEQVIVGTNMHDKRAKWRCTTDPTHEFVDSWATIYTRMHPARKRVLSAEPKACRICHETAQAIARANTRANARADARADTRENTNKDQ